MEKQNIRRKSKYIIYNSNFEILAFKLDIDTRKHNSEIMIPTLTESGIDVSELNNFYLKIINMLPIKEIKFFTSKETKKEVFTCQNGKLKKRDSYNIRDYFMCNYDFSDEELEYIKLISKQFDFEVVFVPIADFNKQKSYIDYSVRNVITEVEKQYIRK